MDDLIIKGAVVYEAAALCGEMYHQLAHKGLADKLREGNDGLFAERLYGAALVLATAAANHLDDYIDWSESMGVFVYEHIESDAGTTVGLVRHLLDCMSLDHWQALAENWELPQDLSAWVLEHLQDWGGSHFPFKEGV